MNRRCPESIIPPMMFKGGDKIQEVDHQKVVNAADFSRIIQQSKGDSILLLVNRGGNTLYVVIKTH